MFITSHSTKKKKKKFITSQFIIEDNAHIQPAAIIRLYL